MKEMNILERSPYECGLGCSISNALYSQLEIMNIGDLLKFSEKELLKCSYVGFIGVKKIKFFLDTHGLKLKESEKVLKKRIQK